MQCLLLHHFPRRTDNLGKSGPDRLAQTSEDREIIATNYKGVPFPSIPGQFFFLTRWLVTGPLPTDDSVTTNKLFRAIPCSRDELSQYYSEESLHYQYTRTKWAYFLVTMSL
jgi:hypothetical protein